MSAEAESHEPPTAHPSQDTHPSAHEPPPPSRPPAPTSSRYQEPDLPAQLDPARLGPVFDTLTSWDDLARQPWTLALLIALDDGPTTSAAACAAAIGWADGQLPGVDMSAALAEVIDAGLATHLGGHGDAALFAMTSAGSQLLDRFEHATRDLRLLNQLADFADTCILHGRLLQLTPTENRVLSLVVHGRTDQHIADTLCLSRRSVESHIRRVLRKLGIRSRNALIARLAIEAVGF